MKNPLLPDRNSPKNWPEDFPHENGNYVRVCCLCKDYFMGHKRRVVCKVCQDSAWYDVQADRDYKDFINKLQGKCDPI